MGLLNLPSGATMLEVQIQANERKKDSNRLRAQIGLLSKVGIHDVLMDKINLIRMRKGVERQVMKLIGGIHSLMSMPAPTRQFWNAAGEHPGYKTRKAELF